MSRCSLCPSVSNCVPPIGDVDAEVFLIGEAPGKDENRLGIPFVGKTGSELDVHFLPLAGLSRRIVYISNARLCYPAETDGKLQMQRSKDVLSVETCAKHHLFEEIEYVRPKIIVPMGAFACHVLDPTISLDLHHGIPRKSPYGTLFPMWHPAGGLHEPKKMLQIRTDWIRLKRLRNNTLPIRKDEFPNPDYEEVTKVSEIRALDPISLMGCDTEFDPDTNPVCLTYSIRPGSGRLIRSDRGDLLRAFQEKLNVWRGNIVFHNWMADWPIVEKMGLDFPIPLIRDSMIKIFHLGNLPKGLKAFAFRELGMEMEDFEDVVSPYSIPRIIDYFLKMKGMSWPKPEASMEYDHKKEKWKSYQAQTLHTKIKRFFTDLGKNPEKDILETWENWEDDRELIESKCGKFYGLDVRDVPMEKLKWYACRDSDATLRAWPILQAMIRNMPGKSQENWRGNE